MYYPGTYSEGYMYGNMYVMYVCMYVCHVCTCTCTCATYIHTCQCTAVHLICTRTENLKRFVQRTCTTVPRTTLLLLLTTDYLPEGTCMCTLTVLPGFFPECKHLLWRCTLIRLAPQPTVSLLISALSTIYFVKERLHWYFETHCCAAAKLDTFASPSHLLFFPPGLLLLIQLVQSTYIVWRGIY